MRCKNRQSGFTLIEIVVVIVLIGILSAIALPRLFDFTSSAEEAVLRSTAGALTSGAQLFRAQWEMERRPQQMDVNGVTFVVSPEGYPVGVSGVTDRATACAQIANTLLDDNGVQFGNVDAYVAGNDYDFISIPVVVSTSAAPDPLGLFPNTKIYRVALSSGTLDTVSDGVSLREASSALVRQFESLPGLTSSVYITDHATGQHSLRVGSTSYTMQSTTPSMAPLSGTPTGYSTIPSSIYRDSSGQLYVELAHSSSTPTAPVREGAVVPSIQSALFPVTMSSSGIPVLSSTSPATVIRPGETATVTRYEGGETLVSVPHTVHGATSMSHVLVSPDGTSRAVSEGLYGATTPSPSTYDPASPGSGRTVYTRDFMPLDPEPTITREIMGVGPVQFTYNPSRQTYDMMATGSIPAGTIILDSEARSVIATSPSILTDIPGYQPGSYYSSSYSPGGQYIGPNRNARQVPDQPTYDINGVTFTYDSSAAVYRSDAGSLYDPLLQTISPHSSEASRFTEGMLYPFTGSFRSAVSPISIPDPLYRYSNNRVGITSDGDLVWELGGQTYRQVGTASDGSPLFRRDGDRTGPIFQMDNPSYYMTYAEHMGAEGAIAYMGGMGLVAYAADGSVIESIPSMGMTPETFTPFEREDIGGGLYVLSRGDEFYLVDENNNLRAPLQLSGGELHLTGADGTLIPISDPSVRTALGETGTSTGTTPTGTTPSGTTPSGTTSGGTTPAGTTPDGTTTGGTLTGSPNPYLGAIGSGGSLPVPEGYRRRADGTIEPIPGYVPPIPPGVPAPGGGTPTGDPALPRPVPMDGCEFVYASSDVGRQVRDSGIYDPTIRSLRMGYDPRSGSSYLSHGG